jgi:hypothetical protein
MRCLRCDEPSFITQSELSRHRHQMRKGDSLHLPHHLTPVCAFTVISLIASRGIAADRYAIPARSEFQPRAQKQFRASTRDTSNDLEAAVYLWWIGLLGPYELPASSAMGLVVSRRAAAAESTRQ